MTKRVTIDALADWLRDKEDVLLLGHEAPDGDAAGSAEALKKLLEAMGRTAKVVFPTPVPEHVAFLTEGSDTVYTDGEEDGYDKVIAVDVASRAQLGKLSHLADKTSLMIDHHATGEAFAPYLTVPAAYLLSHGSGFPLNLPAFLVGDLRPVRGCNGRAVFVNSRHTPEKQAVRHIPKRRFHPGAGSGADAYTLLAEHGFLRCVYHPAVAVVVKPSWHRSHGRHRPGLRG